MEKNMNTFEANLEKLEKLNELKEKGISGVAAMKRTVCDLKYASYMANNTNQMVNLNVKYNAQKEVPPGKRIDFFDVFDGINWVDSKFVF